MNRVMCIALGIGALLLSPMSLATTTSTVTTTKIETKGGHSHSKAKKALEANKAAKQAAKAERKTTK